MMNHEINVILGVAVFNLRLVFDAPMLANLPNNVCERGICEFSL